MKALALRTVPQRLKAIATSAAAAFGSAVLWFAALAIAGLLLVVAGVFVLAGYGWALVAGGVGCLVLSGVMMRGLGNG